METFYIARANVNCGKLKVRKDQSITKGVYDSLPAKFKIKFSPGKAAAEPIGLNEIVGDNPEEKAKRIRMSKEAELAELMKEADLKIADLEKQLEKAGKDYEDLFQEAGKTQTELMQKLSDQEKCGADLTEENSALKAKVADLEKQLADTKVKKK